MGNDPIDVPIANARDCAQMLLEMLPTFRRGLHELTRQQKGIEPDAQTMGQSRLLKILSRGPRTLGELAAHHGVTPSTMSRSIDVLVRRGWVSRESNPADRRQVILRLTGAGQAAQTELARQTEDMLTQLIEELAPAEQERLFDGLDVLQTLLARTGTTNPCNQPADPTTEQP